MTDRFHSLQVVLEKDVREDDAQAICDAISQIRGVQAVTGLVTDGAALMARVRASATVHDQLLEMARNFEF